MKNLQKIDKDFLLNEVIFQNRNKNYGAYVLRNEEGNVLMKSMLFGIALIGAVSLAPLLLNAFQSEVVVKDDSGGHILVEIPEAPEKTPDVIKPIIQTAPKVNTVKYDIPTPTKNSKKQTPAPTIQQIEKANIGTENITGVPPTISVSPPINVNAPISVETKVPMPIDNTPKSVVDVEAAFAGGINTFRSKVVQNFDTAGFDGTGELMKTTVTFIVEKDGSISGIKANGNNAEFSREAENTIKSIKGKWAPAQLNGQNVRSFFTFPISIQFE